MGVLREFCGNFEANFVAILRSFWADFEGNFCDFYGNFVEIWREFWADFPEFNFNSIFTFLTGFQTNFNFFFSVFWPCRRLGPAPGASGTPKSPNCSSRKILKKFLGICRRSDTEVSGPCSAWVQKFKFQSFVSPKMGKSDPKMPWNPLKNIKKSCKNCPENFVKS